LAFLAQNKAKLCKNLIITLIFEKNANFFAENCRKTQKIVIIDRPKCSPTYSLQYQYMHNFYRAKSSQKIRANTEIFKKAPKENNRPRGEKSPNPITVVKLSFNTCS
jgi:hypothetical protein